MPHVAHCAHVPVRTTSWTLPAPPSTVPLAASVHQTLCYMGMSVSHHGNAQEQVSIFL